MTTTATLAPADQRAVPAVDYPLYDADEHYYETVDTYTRHLPRSKASAIQWIEMRGQRRLLVNNKLFTMNIDPAFDRVGAPGALEKYFRGINPEGKEVREIVGDQVQSGVVEYRDRDARLRTLDGQGVAATLLFPTSGVGMECLLRDRPRDLTALITAFNRWLEEDWGFAYQNRLFAAPLMSLVDPEAAVAELERVRDAGARFVAMVPGPVVSGPQSWSPGDPRFDRFWATAADAGIVVAYHGGDSGYDWIAQKWGEGQFEGLDTSPLPEVMQLHIERPIQDTLAAIVSHGVFDRHPTLRMASIESGSTWALHLIKRMRSAYGKIPQKFKQDPVQSFREHLWISPYYEDDFDALRDAIGADHMLFGSDWPHPEGLHQPKDYVADIQQFSPAEQRMILSDNLRGLLGLAA
ncbi:MAG TPA: amidohydrolase family protein [Mycobacteriales bacterium]|jgi:predicted TIM-barrel fold metal-dependent hydrolase|nr:amidohydrolase family protein [Mycobacteriales bacterium]